jgi:hypothetical protein
MFVPINREYMSSLKGGNFTTTGLSVSDSVHAKFAIKNAQTAVLGSVPNAEDGVGSRLS